MPTATGGLSSSAQKALRLHKLASEGKVRGPNSPISSARGLGLPQSVTPQSQQQPASPSTPAQPEPTPPGSPDANPAQESASPKTKKVSAESLNRLALSKSAAKERTGSNDAMLQRLQYQHQRISMQMENAYGTAGGERHLNESPLGWEALARDEMHSPPQSARPAPSSGPLSPLPPRECTSAPSTARNASQAASPTGGGSIGVDAHLSSPFGELPSSLGRGGGAVTGSSPAAQHLPLAKTPPNTYALGCSRCRFCKTGGINCRSPSFSGKRVRAK